MKLFVNSILFASISAIFCAHVISSMNVIAILLSLIVIFPSIILNAGVATFTYSYIKTRSIYTIIIVIIIMSGIWTSSIYFVSIYFLSALMGSFSIIIMELTPEIISNFLQLFIVNFVFLSVQRLCFHWAKIEVL
jgi:hypothetical protein